MNVKYFCPRWGSEQMPWKEFFQRVKDEGYDGVEYAIAYVVPFRELDLVWNEAERQHVRMIAQHYDTYTADYDLHFNAYRGWLDRIREYPVVLVNSQTGKDFFSYEQNRALIGLAEAFTAETGVRVCHETHRNKFSFAAHVTKDYLKQIAGLRITMDVSHWVCVAESYLEDQGEAMELAIGRTDHLHARVGYPEGPQVVDPRAPEWEGALQAHLRWWDAVVRLACKEGRSLTISPEFGPAPYLVELPFSRQPVADQWEVNVWMMRLLKERYHVLI